MSDIALGNMWLFGYYFFITLYSFCMTFTQIKSSWNASILFALTGDWRVNEVAGDEQCRTLISALM
jgi:hypothetical protein